MNDASFADMKYQTIHIGLSRGNLVLYTENIAYYARMGLASWFYANGNITVWQDL